ncbi:predicted protein [Arabidopsis lyrata subsp. lyrata]|uniref:Predicted protein n=1 Tax=Arabidopsis lyrata subsp. lyrata TaxID=81972 RepID=D7MBZ0_ARALL|nr:predicted protein [Arabidopsis lyrata subsp. lyrata]
MRLNTVQGMMKVWRKCVEFLDKSPNLSCAQRNGALMVSAECRLGCCTMSNSLIHVKAPSHRAGTNVGFYTSKLWFYNLHQQHTNIYLDYHELQITNSHTIQTQVETDDRSISIQRTAKLDQITPHWLIQQMNPIWKQES